jgi:hypothetical protein
MVCLFSWFRVKLTNWGMASRKPLPLTTVELQKAGSRLLHMAPKKVLDVCFCCFHLSASSPSWLTVPKIAEKLYQQGFLSYPRTETDQFDPQFDLMSLIIKQTVDPVWGGFATGYVSTIPSWQSDINFTFNCESACNKEDLVLHVEGRTMIRHIRPYTLLHT